MLAPPAFVWCIAGPHIGETLPEIVERKQRDIERFGWCLWAYGSTGNSHPENEVRRLAREHGRGETLPLLMPDTGKAYPENGRPFDAYRVTPTGEPVSLPEGMSPVTGGQRSWAFYVTSLAWSADATVDVGRYVAPFPKAGPRSLTEYLRGSHGRACAARSDAPTEGSLRRVHVVAEIRDPYAVFLVR